MVGTIASGPELGVLGKRISGVLWSGPWLAPSGARSVKAAYLADFERHFTNCCDGSGFDVPFHDAMAATAEALALVHGDLSGGGRRFMAALAHVRLDSPTGAIRLDSSREAISPSYRAGVFDNAHYGRSDGVEHTFGGYFTPQDPAPSKATPACRKRTPPAWAR